MKWREPRIAVRLRAEQSRRRDSLRQRVLVFLIFWIGLLMLNRLSRNAEAPDLPIAAVIAALAAGFFTLIPVWIRRLPCEVRILQDRLMLLQGNSAKAILFTSVKESEFQALPPDPSGTWLWLISTGGPGIPIGVPAEQLPELQDFLDQVNLPWAVDSPSDPIAPPDAP